MKVKILKTLGIVLLLIVTGLLFNLVDYGTAQEYAKIATQQVSGDAAYYALKTTPTVVVLYRIIFAVVNIFLLGLLYPIWKSDVKKL